MFNGIIEHTGTVNAIDLERHTCTFEAPSLAKNLKKGESIAVNGTCLTVVSVHGALVATDVMPETLKKTNLGECTKGDMVNLELPLTPASLVSGHFVYGHIDTTAKLLSITPDENARILLFEIQNHSFMKYIVEKGSIALNGISLTVIEADEAVFSVGIIPHTWAHTNLSLLHPDDKVNIEVDMLAKYVEKHCLHSRLSI